jgi:molybdate transport system regulatory protein
MSYMRAWTLIKTTNACFREPLGVASRGGKERGGAVLTETGRKVFGLYRDWMHKVSKPVEASGNSFARC